MAMARGMNERGRNRWGGKERSKAGVHVLDATEEKHTILPANNNRLPYINDNTTLRSITNVSATVCSNRSTGNDEAELCSAAPKQNTPPHERMVAIV